MKNYSKLILVALIAIALIGVASASVKAQSVNFVQKDPNGWTVIDNGVTGKMTYKVDPKAMFVFNAKGLVKKEKYTLVTYNIPPHPYNSEVLGSATTDKHGRITIKGGSGWVKDIICKGYSTGAGTMYYNVTFLVWLVPSTDLPDGYFNAWNPTTYLFGQEPITVSCPIAPV